MSMGYRRLPLPPLRNWTPVPQCCRATQKDTPEVEIFDPEHQPPSPRFGLTGLAVVLVVIYELGRIAGAW